MTTPEALPRADVLAAVRAAWDESAREKHGNPIIALTTVLRVLGMGEHVAVVDGHAVLVNEAARTPETVLRAMLRAYEAAALEAEIAYMRTRPNIEAAAVVHERCKSLTDDVERLRRETACVIAWAGPEHLMGCVLADYQARLAGTRPLDAPPMEMP